MMMSYVGLLSHKLSMNNVLLLVSSKRLIIRLPSQKLRMNSVLVLVSSCRALESEAIQFH